jgi:formate hydrogenlyase subunit 3/multisubunit Na+/H+ antiporter MnhD subunit
MIPVAEVLWCVAILLAVGVLSVALGRMSQIHRFTYGVSLVASSAALIAAAAQLFTPGDVISRLTLPLGLPWLGAHFCIDSLAGFFLVVVNLGGAAASLYGLGYGRHEHSPRRVLSFIPMFLAGMNLVVLAADAFTFLFSW